MVNQLVPGARQLHSFKGTNATVFKLSYTTHHHLFQQAYFCWLTVALFLLNC